MKKLSHMLALLLALLLALNAFALAEDAASASEPEAPAEAQTETDASADEEQEGITISDDTALFAIYDREVTKAEVSQMLGQLAAQDYVEDDNDYDAAIEYLIQQIVGEHKIQEWGLDVFTEEEEAAFLTSAQEQWEEMLDYYVSYFLTEDTDEARAQARLDAEAYYTAYGLSVDILAEDNKLSACYDRLQNKVLEGQDISAGEEEIHQVFEDYAGQDRETFGNNIAMYEMYQNYGYECWYQPAGYRGILHILLDTDQELLDAYLDAQAAYEESISGEEETEEASASAMKEQADAAYNALMAKHQSEIDDIYAQLAQGASFESLIAQYGTDPGMSDAENLANGYAVHQESIMWDPAFTAGAYSEKMVKPGDVSDPVVGTNGIHILYYLRDIPEGYVEMTEDIRGQIEQYVTGTKQNAIITAALDEWIAEANVVYYDDAIAAVKAAAYVNGD